MAEFNPWLAPRPAGDAEKGGPEAIERPERVANIAWQTRAAVPSPEEAALADALEAIFGDEVYELGPIVARLNRDGVPAPGGSDVWTEANFLSELARLGA